MGGLLIGILLSRTLHDGQESCAAPARVPPAFPQTTVPASNYVVKLVS
jgi:hypothetical protein